jgi:hypothetical protein
MRKILWGMLLILLSAGLLALPFSVKRVESLDAPATAWNRTYGGDLDDMYHDTVVITSDGGYVIAGYTQNFGAIQKDFWLVKTNSTGHVEWNRTYDHDGGTERPLSAIQTSDGGYAIVGVAGTSEAALNSFDYWLVKTDVYGNHEWNKTYDGGARDEATDIVETEDGGYAIIGYTTSFGGDVDAWLVKTYADGTLDWNYAYGGAGPDYGYSMTYTNAGEYVVAGQTGPYGSTAFWLFKVNATGHAQWSETYGGSANTGVALSVTSTSDGGYAMTGYMWPSESSDADFWLVKTDSAGNMEWNHTYGGGSDDQARCVVQTNDQGYAIIGATNSFGVEQHDFWLVKTDSTGNMEWNVTCGGSREDWGRSLVATSDGGYALAGYTNSFGTGGYDCWLIKLASLGFAAEIDVDPSSLNLRARGDWIMCYVEFPEGYNINAVDTSSIRMNETIPVDLGAPSAIGDYDNDGVPDVMVKLDRADVIAYIRANVNLTMLVEQKFLVVTLTLTGALNDGTSFEGHDCIRIIYPKMTGAGPENRQFPR